MSSHLTAHALWAIPRVGAPVATADTVVTTVTTYPSEPGSGITRIWRVPLDGSASVPLTASDRSATKPALSPDGRKVAFLRAVDGLNQIHVMPLTGGEADAVSEFAFGAVGMRWFPDSRRLVAIADVLIDAPTMAGTAALVAERAKETHSARTTDVAVFRYWDRWLTEGRVPHLFVIEPGQVPHDITPASTGWMRWDNTDDPIDDIDISPDGAEVAACFDTSTAPHRDLRWSLFAIDVAAGEGRDLTPDATGHASGPRYTPDGESLIFGQTTDPHFYADRVRLVRLDRVSGAVVDLTEDWDRSPSAWAVDADGIVLIAEDRGSQPVWTLPLDGGTPERHGNGGTFSGAVRVEGGRIVANRNSIDAPPELVVIDGERTERLTDFTAESLSGITLATAEEFSFEGARGDTVQGWLVRPPGVDSPAPLVHMIHGGPHGSFGDSWHWRWNAAVFCGASRVAALVNFHGSTGFGQEFAECIRGDWGDLPTADIERATDHLVAAGIADPDKLGIAGGSYGGYMVAWLVSQTDRYRCAVAHAAVTDLPGMYASDITSGRTYAYGAEVWEDLGRINRWSPAAHAAGYSTPTLVIHGERDYRVPVTQSLEFYGVLQAMGVESRLVYYPDENHWILSQANSLHWYGEVLAWLERHIG